MFPFSKLIRSTTAGVVKQVCASLKGPASYTTGGETCTIPSISGGRIKNADFVHMNALSVSGTYSASVKYGAEGQVSSIVLKATVVATGAEVANAVDLSAERWRIVVQGN
jgi:hypothetical protein